VQDGILQGEGDEGTNYSSSDPSKSRKESTLNCLLMLTVNFNTSMKRWEM